jgi:hypothetical protein
MAPFMQSRFGEEQYPIARLILHQAQALGLSRTMIVRRLGYTDLTNGHRALTDLMMTGTVPPFCTRLAEALEVDQSIIEAAIIATARQQDAEAAIHRLAKENAYRKAFRPHLQIQVERDRPSPVFIAALRGIRSLRIVDLPNLDAAEDESVREQIVRRIIQQHYQDNGGHASCFGAITGYVLVCIAGYDVDFGVPYDTEGHPTGSMVSVERLPEATWGRRRGDERLGEFLRKSLIGGAPEGHDGLAE